MSFSVKEFYQFDVFCQIVESGGITNAEYVTGLSQPSLSAILAKLEKKLNMRLCDRGRSGFQLTPQGEAVYKEAKIALTSFNSFSETLTELKGELIGQVSIGSIDNLLSYQPSPITQALQYAKGYAPNIRYTFFQSDIYQLERRLMDGTDQLLIGVIPDRLKSHLRSEILYHEESQLYIASSTPESELKSIKVITGGYSSDTVSNLVNDHFEYLEVLDQLSLDAGLMHILSGNYAVFLPIHYANQYVQCGLIKNVEQNTYRYTSQVSVSFNPKRKLNLASEFILKSLIRYANTHT